METHCVRCLLLPVVEGLSAFSNTGAYFLQSDLGLWGACPNNFQKAGTFGAEEEEGLHGLGIILGCNEIRLTIKPRGSTFKKCRGQG